MARFPFLDAADLPAEHRDLLAAGGINLKRVLAHSPNATRRLDALAMYIRRESRLDPRLRELAIIQVGYVANAPYEYSHHVKIGLEVGVSPADLRAIADETNGRATTLEPLAKAVLQAARELTLGTSVSDAVFAALARELAPELVTDLLLAIAFYNAVIRLLGALQIDLEPDYRRFLDEYPLATATGR